MRHNMDQDLNTVIQSNYPPANYQYYRQGPHYPTEHGAPPGVMPPGPAPNPAMNEPPQLAPYTAPPPAQQPPPTPMETNENGNFAKSNLFEVILPTLKMLLQFLQRKSPRSLMAKAKNHRPNDDQYFIVRQEIAKNEKNVEAFKTFVGHCRM